MTIAMEVATTQPADVSERDHRRFMNAALRAAAVEHLLTRLKKHFEYGVNNTHDGPPGTYEYARPSDKYLVRKVRKYGHRKPNVFSGLERQHVLANSTVTATHRRSRVVISGLHPKTSDQGELWRRTMSAIADDERPEITETVHSTYFAQLAEHRSSRKVQQRGADGRFI